MSPITDDSFTTAALALQGPNSRAILNAVSSDSLDSLKFFWMMDTHLVIFPYLFPVQDIQAILVMKFGWIRKML